MSRYYQDDPRVVRLMETLRPLYEEAGSVNQLCIKLNEALGAVKVYPNRLHTLLHPRCSHHAVNEATLLLVERACKVIASQPAATQPTTIRHLPP